MATIDDDARANKMAAVKRALNESQGKARGGPRPRSLRMLPGRRPARGGMVRASGGTNLGPSTRAGGERLNTSRQKSALMERDKVNAARMKQKKPGGTRLGGGAATGEVRLS
jgi:hypothetical protein